jgi:hypothetical protein
MFRFLVVIVNGVGTRLVGLRNDLSWNWIISL